MSTDVRKDRPGWEDGLVWSCNEADLVRSLRRQHFCRPDIGIRLSCICMAWCHAGVVGLQGRQCACRRHMVKVAILRLKVHIMIIALMGPVACLCICMQHNHTVFLFTLYGRRTVHCLRCVKRARHISA